MSKTILVLSDGDTWEEMNDEIKVMEVTEAAFEKIMDGEKPKNLTPSDILNGALLEDLWENQ